MGKTRDKVEKILEPAIIADPAVLKVDVYGAAAVDDREVLAAALRMIGALSQSVGALADEIDDLRAAADSR